MPEGKSSSGRGRRSAGASETQPGGGPRTARRPDDTTTPASAPTYSPGRPGGANTVDTGQSDSNSHRAGELISSHMHCFPPLGRFSIKIKKRQWTFLTMYESGLRRRSVGLGEGSPLCDPAALPRGRGQCSIWTEQDNAHPQCQCKHSTHGNALVESMLHTFFHVAWFKFHLFVLYDLSVMDGIFSVIFMRF